MWPRIRVALVVWLAMVGLDFVLNAGLFAGMYQEGGPFLLPPLEAFRRIPLGYLAFLILAAAMVELSFRLHATTIAAGLRLGATAGATPTAVTASASVLNGLPNVPLPVVPTESSTNQMTGPPTLMLIAAAALVAVPGQPLSLTV